MARRAKIGRMGLCTALLGLAATGGAQTTPWKMYSYAADGFSASFENLSDIQKKTVPTDTGPIELRTYSEQIGSVELMVTVSDYGAALKGKDADAELEGAKNAAVKNAERGSRARSSLCSTCIPCWSTKPRTAQPTLRFAFTWWAPRCIKRWWQHPLENRLQGRRSFWIRSS